MPDQSELYTHRSGRTGRAGKKGISIALITPKEKGKLRPIEGKINKKFEQKEVPNGKEICEKQLFSLIDKVHDIDINEKEISGFLPDIYKKLEGLERDELIKRFVSLEFNQFLSYYENTRDLNEDGSNVRERSSDDSFTRFFINLGKTDDLNPARLIGLINENISKNNVEIGQIEILKNFSFFEIDKNFGDDILKGLGNAEFNNRKVIVEVTTKPKPSGGRKRNGFKKSSSGGRNFKEKTGFKGARREGGFKEKSSSDRNFKSRRRSR